MQSSSSASRVRQRCCSTVVSPQGRASPPASAFARFLRRRLRPVRHRRDGCTAESVGGARELQTAARDCGVGALVFAAGATAAAEAIDPDRRLPQLSATVEGLAPRQPAKLPPVSGGTDAVYLLSSGSTGRPVVRTPMKRCWPTAWQRPRPELTPDDVILNAPGPPRLWLHERAIEAAPQAQRPSIGPTRSR